MNIGGQLGEWPKVVPLGNQLLAVIRSLMEDSDPLLLDHAEDQMWARDIDMFDIKAVLKNGDIKGEIRPGKNDQEWICKIVYPARLPENHREIGVVTIVMSAAELLIMTVEWED